MKKLFFLFLALVLIWGCKKTKNQDLFSLGSGILILNQGNFTYGNASVSYLRLQDQTVFQDLFFSVNNFRLGDVAQSAIAHANKIFIVVNNSGKILVVDNETFEYDGVITGLVSPRYILPISDSLALVSDLYSTQLTLINLFNYNIESKFEVGYSTERMILYENYAFIVNWNNGWFLLRLNLQDFSVQKLKINYQPNSLVVDKFGRIWVLSDGGLWQGADTLTFPTLTVVEPDSFVILRNFQFDSLNISPSNLCINASGDTLYFLVSAWQPTVNPAFGIYRMSVNDTALPDKPFIPQNQHTFYELNFLTEKNWLAVTDAKDFIRPGNVLIFTTNAKLVFNIQAGIIPGFVMFKN
jgi:hypothetical protein